MVLWGSLSLAQAPMAADLIDEYHLQLCPTPAGAGRRLFTDPDAYARLRRVDVRAYDTGVVFLHYEPQRGAQPGRARRPRALPPHEPSRRTTRRRRPVHPQPRVAATPLTRSR
jgi:hypothetical protein